MYPDKISGILDCKNKTIFGINKKSNTPLVIFNPHDSNLPKFLIPSKLKYTNKNHFCIIRFNRNDPKYRFPIGDLIHVIGDVNDKIANYEYILHCNKLNLKEPTLSKTKMRKLRKITNIWDIINKQNLPTYKDYRDIQTISVDPIGSKDIDDAISIYGDKIGIHIADVSFWLRHFQIMPEFSSTIYLPHRKINMIPSLLADNLASLLEGKDRLALTLWYDTKSGFVTYEDTIIKVKKNYTYENFELYKNINHFNHSKIIGEKYGMDLTNWDSHKMIEAFMILANNETAKYLNTHNLHFYRTHSEKHHQIDLNQIKNPQFHEFMEIYLSNSATYTSEKGRHYGLGLDLYTHFTSPIRRLADVYVHMVIKDNQTTNQIDFDKINNDIKLTKKLTRDIERYDIIQNLKQTTEYEGYVVNFNPNNDMVTMYFPALKFCDKFDILPRRLNDINNEEMLKRQRDKIKKFENIKVCISKKDRKLIYSF